MQTTLEGARAGAVESLGVRVHETVRIQMSGPQRTSAAAPQQIALTFRALLAELAYLPERERDAVLTVFRYELHALVGVCMLEATMLKLEH